MASSMEFIPGRKRAPQSLGRVLVLGLGKSGRVAARYCAALLGTRVDALYVAAGSANDDARAFVEELSASASCADPCVCEFGDAVVPMLAKQAGSRFDLCIASPGIPYWAQLYQDAQAHSAEVVSEVEFAWRESADSSVWVAITGTNGKTTTTSCCASLLSSAGMNAKAVGNIGDVCLKAVSEGNTDVYVAEASSYQLASTRDFAPNVAVCLNITPDHVHWHKTFEAYRDAKFKVLENLGKVPGSVAVLDASNDVVRAKVRQIKAVMTPERGYQYVPMGTSAGMSGDMRVACGSDNAAFITDEGMLVVAFDGKEHQLCRADELKIHGLHNASNALAASVAAIALGVSDDVIVSALRSFAPLEHRIEPCGSINGVACFNDSKATNVDATLKALTAFPNARPIVLLGGDDKGTDLSDLVREVYKHARAAVCFGAAADRFLRAFSENGTDQPEGFLLLSASNMESALDAALDVAHSGDVVLLSPACASFDEFHSFEERGTVFKRLVSERSSAASAASDVR